MYIMYIILKNYILYILYTVFFCCFIFPANDQTFLTANIRDDLTPESFFNNNYQAIKTYSRMVCSYVPFVIGTSL